MKMILLAAMLSHAFSTFALQAQVTTFPFSEGFEDSFFPPPFWTSTGTPGWGRTTNKFHSGSACAGVWYTPAGQSILQTPQILIPPYHQISFWWNDFDFYLDPTVHGTDTTFFEISTDLGNSWNTLDTLSSPTPVDTWVHATHDLTPYSNLVVLFRWRDRTNGTSSAYGTTLDDILIETIPIITYEPLKSSPSGAGIVLSTTVLPMFTCDSSTAGAPRFWYRVGTSIPVTGPYADISGSRRTPGDSVWEFPLPNLASGSFVEYYVAMQTADSWPQVFTEPANSGPTTLNPPNAVFVPAPARFMVKAPLDFTVGTAGTEFPNITTGIEWLSWGFDGHARLLLASSYSSTGESFPILVQGLRSDSGTSLIPGRVVEDPAGYAADGDVLPERLMKRSESRTRHLSPQRAFRSLSRYGSSPTETVNRLTIAPAPGASPGAIMSSTDPVIAIRAVANVTLEDLSITNTALGGFPATVQIEQSTGVQLHGCTARGGEPGMCIEAVGGNTNLVVDSCTIGNAWPGSSGPSIGIYSAYGTGDTIRGCTIRDIYYASGSGTGIFLGYFTRGAVVEGNEVLTTVAGPVTSLLLGINVGTSSAGVVYDVRMRRNKIHDLNASAGAEIRGINISSASFVQEVVVEDNTITRLGGMSTLSGPVTGIRVSKTVRAHVSRNRLSALQQMGSGTVFGFYRYNPFAPEPTAVTFTNNFVELGAGGNTSSECYGVVVDGESDDTVRVTFNSVRVGAMTTSGTSSGLLRTNTPTTLVHDNILVSRGVSTAGTHAAVSNASWGPGWTGDYNLLHSVGGVPGSWLGVPQATLAAWRTASGGDAHSVTGDPLFVNADSGDLHLRPEASPPSPASNAGIPYGGIIEDIDGEAGLRGTTPDIGADEFTVVTPITAVTFQVSMKQQMREGTFRPDLGDVVTLKGSFNNWGNPPDSNSLVMGDPDNDSTFSRAVPLAPGGHIYFHWKSLRGGPGDEYVSRTIEIGTADTILPRVYFNNNGPPVPVTFQVNMSVQMQEGLFSPSEGDSVNALFFIPSISTPKFQDPEQDSLYTLTFDLPSGYLLRYRFHRRSATSEDYEWSIPPREYFIPGETPVVIPPDYFDKDSVAELPGFVTVPEAVSFGSVVAGDSLSQLLRVLNTGADSLWIESAIVSDSGAFSIVPSTASIPAGDSLRFTIWFRPDSSCVYVDTVIFVHNAPGSPSVVPVTGIGLPPGPSPKFVTLAPETLIAKNPASGKLLKPVKRHKGLMPNWANLLDETVAQGGFQPGSPVSDSVGGLVAGVSHMTNIGGKWKVRKDSAAVRAWVRLTKWNASKALGKGFSAIQKTLEDKTGVHNLLPPRGFDVTTDGKNKPLLKQFTKLAPKKQNNVLFAELVAFKCALGASALGKTPPGLGNLIFDRDSSAFDELGLFAVSERVDTMLTYWQLFTPAAFADAYATLRDINRAFAAPFDTASFNIGGLVLKGATELADVPFLKAPTTFTPTRISRTTADLESGEDVEWDEGENEEGAAPVALRMYQNYPNPFNPSTTIGFRLRDPARVTVRVFTLLGQEVEAVLQQEDLADGVHEITFDADGLASGVYLYRIEVRPDNESASPIIGTGKMLLIR